MRLAVEWRARRFRFLLNLIDQLPAASRYGEAVAQDDDLAQALLYVEPTPAPPPLAEWSPLLAEMRVMSERLGIVAQILANGRYKPEPLPRPQTARDRAKRRADQATHARLTAILLPDSEGVDGGLSS